MRLCLNRSNWSLQLVRPRSASLLVVAAVFVFSMLAGALDSFIPGVVAHSSSSRQVGTSLQELAQGDRYSSYNAIQDVAPGSTIVSDAFPKDLDDWDAVSPVLLIALAEVSEIRTEDLSWLRVSDESITERGIARHGHWTLHVSPAEDAVETLLITETEGVVRIVDARLTAYPAADRGAVATSPTLRPPAVAGGLIDGSLLTFLLIAGGYFLPRTAVSPSLRLALALPVGIAVLGALGVLRLPGLWSLAAVVPAAGVAHLWVVKGGDKSGWRREDFRGLCIVLVSVFAVATWSRANGFFWVSPDSIAYLARAKLLAEGKLTVSMVQLKRGAALQQLHAPGFALGVDGFQALGAAAIVLSVALLLASPSVLGQLQRPDNSDVQVFGIALAAAFLTLAFPAIPVMAAYVNSHMLLAVVLLTLVCVLDLAAKSGEDGRSEARFSPAIGALITVIVLLRPEGTLLAAFLLLGTLRSSRPAAASSWVWLGLATIAWNAHLVHGYFQRGEDAAPIVLAALAGGSALLMIPLLIMRISGLLRRLLPIAFAGLLWSVTLVIDLGFQNVVFFENVIANLGEGRGQWGAAGVLLLLLGFLAVGVREEAEDGPGILGARWLLIGFIPITALSRLGAGLERSDSSFSTLLSGGGRIGWGDSVNRMWTHAVLLVLALVVARIVRLLSQVQSPQPNGGVLASASGELPAVD